MASLIITINFLCSLLFIQVVFGDPNTYSHEDSDERRLAACCGHGARSAIDNFSNRTSCTHLYENNFSRIQVSNEFNDECRKAFEICCIREQRNEHCKAGKEIALKSGKCPSITEFIEKGVKDVESASFVDCCFACVLGINAARSNRHCSFCYLESPWNDHFYECCSRFKESTRQQQNRCSHKRTCGAYCANCGHENQQQQICNPGLWFCPNSRMCLDIDECQEGFHNCQQNEKCVNTYGSFKCVKEVAEFTKRGQVNDRIAQRGDIPSAHQIQCLTGFHFNLNLRRCDDIDECDLHLHSCRSDQTCVNTIGSFVCRCADGSPLNERGECRNKHGGECDPGFRRDNYGRCVDINECEEYQHLCSHRCINTHGSYKCECRNGFKLMDDKATCEDIDECAEFEKIKSGIPSFTYMNSPICRGICTNTEGSYSCQCPPGYEKRNHICADINECERTRGLCREKDSTCLNTAGSHKCFYHRCPPGYVKDDLNKDRCVQKRDENVHKDDCPLEHLNLDKPLSISYRYITFTPKVFIPDGGLQFFHFGFECGYCANVDFSLDVNPLFSGHSVEKVSKSNFKLDQTGHNAMLRLMREIQGPQDVELKLLAKTFAPQKATGFHEVNIRIIVSEHGFKL